MWDVSRSWCSQWRHLHWNKLFRLPRQSVERSWHLQSKNYAVLKEIVNIGQVSCVLIVSMYLQQPVHICVKLTLVYSEMGWDKFFLSHVTLHVETWRGPSTEALWYSRQCTTTAALTAHHSNGSPVCMQGRRCQAIHTVQVHHLLRDVKPYQHSLFVNPGVGNDLVNLQPVQLSC